MALRNIIREGDPILRKVSRPVENFDQRLWTLLDDMAETLYRAEGVGLAAPQVGVLRRVVIVDVGQGLHRTDKSGHHKEERHASRRWRAACPAPARAALPAAPCG